MSTIICWLSLPVLVSTAQQENSDVPTVQFDIERIEVTGDNPFTEKETRNALSAFIGSSQTIDELRQASKVLITALQNEGYSFYQVTIPSQELTDRIFTLNVEKSVVDKISVEGNQHHSSENILRSIPELKQGTSPNTKALSRALSLANFNPSKQTRVTFSKSKLPGKIDAIVKVIDLKVSQSALAINNTGSAQTGRNRITGAFKSDNLFDRDHAGSLSVTTSEEGFGQVTQVGATYQAPLHKVGGIITGYGVVSNVDTGIIADFFDVSGSGEILGLRYLHPLKKQGDSKHQLVLHVSDKLFDNEIDFAGTPLGIDVRSRPLSLRYQRQTAKKTWNANSYIEVAKNLSGGGFNTDEAYQATRSGANRNWTTWVVGANFNRNIKNWTIEGSIAAFGSDDRLITGEQFGVGGVRTVRGFGEREVRGDNGYNLKLQLWAPTKGKSLRLGGFIDHGKVRNNAPVEDELSSDEITSTGINLIWRPRKHLTMEFGYGYILDGVEEPFLGSRDGDSKLHFNLTHTW